MSDFGLRIVLYLVIFLAVALAVEGAFLYARDIRGARRRVNQRLQMLDQGMSRSQVMQRLRRQQERPINLGPLNPWVERLGVSLGQAGLRLSVRRCLLLMLAASGTVFVLGVGATTALGKILVPGSMLLTALFALAVGVGLPMVLIGHKRERRLKKLAEQFPVALDIFVRGLRAGHPVGSALELLTSEMEDPIGTEFGIVVDEVTYGLDLRDALQNMADRLGLPDLHMFVVSVSIQNETGGNLAEILENLTGVIRERASLLMKVRALSSEGRMTGVMLSVLPVFAFCSVFTMNPGFYFRVADDPAFMPAVGGILLLYSTGVYTIKRLVNLKV